MPDLEVYVIDVSFFELKNAKERAYLNEQPTSFILPAEAVRRLRAAARTIVLESPEVRRYLNDLGERIVTEPASGGASGPAP